MSIVLSLSVYVCVFCLLTQALANKRASGIKERKYNLSPKKTSEHTTTKKNMATQLTCNEDIADVLLSLKESMAAKSEMHADLSKTRPLKRKRESPKNSGKKTGSIRYLHFPGEISKAAVAADQRFLIPFEEAADPISRFVLDKARESEACFFRADPMQSRVLTKFWNLNYGTPPTKQQLEWLAMMTSMDPTAVRRWFEYRNSEAYRRRMKVRRVTHGDLGGGGGGKAPGDGRRKIKVNLASRKKMCVLLGDGGRDAKDGKPVRRTVIVL